jgi:hypothetical protein
VAASCVTNCAEYNRGMFYACEESDFNKHAMRPGCPWARNDYGQTVTMSTCLTGGHSVMWLLLKALM